MGIIALKLRDNNSKLLRHCQERKELIEAAADCRYQLAAAHVSYFESLLDVGNALNQFVEEELLVLSDWSDHESSEEDDQSEPESTAFDHLLSEVSSLASPSNNLQTSSASANPATVSPQFAAAAAAGVDPLHGDDQGSPQEFYEFDESGVKLDDPYDERATRVDPAPSSASVLRNVSDDWDPLNPLKVIDDDMNSNFYFPNYYYFGEFNSDEYYRELKKREGIPDLEDENMLSSKGESSGTRGENSQTPMSKEKHKSDPITDEEEHIIHGLDALAIVVKDQNTVTSTEDGETETETETSSLTSLDDCESKNINEIVKKIRDTFQTAFNCGKEVAVFLEAGRLPYQQPMSAKLKAKLKDVASRIRIFGFTLFQSHQSPYKAMLGKVMNGDSEDMSRKFGDLSSTLEQLCAWEKKLYAEVMEEEKLRPIYDKKYDQQKVLDHQGAEYSEIDQVHVSLGRVLSNINVAIRAVDAISRRIHNIRDEELLAQLRELIEGLQRMWDFMAKCHQKQFRIIIGTKAYAHMANADSRKSSKMKATLRLAKKILNWGTRFRDYVNTQKNFMEFLNEWLSRCIYHQPEETPDGMLEFSPFSIGAPPIFTICSDWYYAINKISDSEVYEAIHKFSLSMHQLWEKQNEEKHERKKAKQLSKEFEKHLRIFQEERGLHWHRDALLNQLGASEFDANGEEADAGDSDDDLVMMNKRLEEQKARHRAIVRQLNDAASNCLQVGLVPIFESLEKFCLENLKAYQQIRFLNNKDKMGRKLSLTN